MKFLKTLKQVSIIIGCICGLAIICGIAGGAPIVLIKNTYISIPTATITFFSAAIIGITAIIHILDKLDWSE